jgi:hypothetical protein
MSSRIDRMRDSHGNEIEEIEKRLRILRLRARFAAARDRSNKVVDRVDSRKNYSEAYNESRKPYRDHDLRPLSNRQPRAFESRGGILDTGLCALPYHGFAMRLFGSESEDDEYLFSDDDNSILEEDRSDEEDDMMSRILIPSSIRHVAPIRQTDRRYVTPSSLQAKVPAVAGTKRSSFQKQPPSKSPPHEPTSPPAVSRDLTCTSTISSHAQTPNTKNHEQLSLSIKTSDTKKTWLSRLKCQSHADKDDIWIPKDIPHILQEHDIRKWNVGQTRQTNQSNVLRSKTWNQDDSSTIATYPSIEVKQPKPIKQTKSKSEKPSNPSHFQSQSPFDGRSFENATPISHSHIKPYRSVSTGRTRSLNSSSGSGTRPATTAKHEMPRVGTGHSRKSTSSSKGRNKTKKVSKPLSIDLKLSASDDSADPYETVHYFQSPYGQPKTGTGTITSSWW